jgi:DNA gyrase/topoisomerase IV subunit A
MQLFPFKATHPNFSQLQNFAPLLDTIKEKYSDDRRTKVVKGGVKAINEEDLIPEKESVLVFTKGGYVKRTDPDEYRIQKRGGVGVVDIETKEFPGFPTDLQAHFCVLNLVAQGLAFIRENIFATILKK